MSAILRAPKAPPQVLFFQPNFTTEKRRHRDQLGTEMRGSWLVVREEPDSICLLSPVSGFRPLVAIVASAFVHTKIVTAGRHWTCKLRPPKVLRASVQLLHFLPFRPEIDPSYPLVRELRRAWKHHDGIPRRSAIYKATIASKTSKVGGKIRLSADFLARPDTMLSPLATASNVPRERRFHSVNPSRSGFRIGLGMTHGLPTPPSATRKPTPFVSPRMRYSFQ